jgi:uncharacterized protein (UPF0548 family)
MSRHLTTTTSALTYPEVGATRDPASLPAGYHHVRRSAVLGEGRDLFNAACSRLTSWQMHRGAGLRVAAAADAAVGVDVVVRLGPRPPFPARFLVAAPCRVVYVVEEPSRRGFAYGTLAGHPESGEECFTVTLTADNRVVADVVAFSRPALWWTRSAGPLVRLTQRWMTDRYIRALRTR